MFRKHSLRALVDEIWPHQIMQEGLLWPPPVVLWTEWLGFDDDRWMVCLYNPATVGRRAIYSFVDLKPHPNMVREGHMTLVAEYIDRKMLALKQIHFMQQAAERGGYY